MDTTVTQSENTEVNPPKLTRRRLQVGISTVLLLIAAVSSWLGLEVLRRETQKLESQLPGLRDAARELRVSNENRISVVQRHKLWNDESIWDINLPASPGFRICLATENVDPQELAPSFQSVNLESGRHKIELTHKNIDDGPAIIHLLIDDKLEIEIKKPQGWFSRFGGYSGGSRISENEEFDVRSPLVLFQMTFMVDTGNGSSMSPQGPADGILLWIEPVVQ